MTDKVLSAVEAELYDRQIRLWGIESQEKLRAANVLLIGVRGLGSEIAKDILLSGINSLTMLDNGVVTEEEQMKNFLLPRDSVGKKIVEALMPKAQALNPLVKIVADTDDPSSKDLKFFEQFTIIAATGIKSSLLLKIDKNCRAHNVQLIYGDVFGMFGYSLADFQEHEFYEDRVQLPSVKRSHEGKVLQESEKTVVKIPRTFQYPDLNKVLILPDTKQKIEPIKKIKRRSQYFYLMLVLIEFRNKTGRNPFHEKKNEDIETLRSIKAEIFNLYDISADKLDDGVFDLVFGEVAPVCSIVGGVIAQEVIKAVSHKEVPINNVFIFDPFTYAGHEESVGN